MAGVMCYTHYSLMVYGYNHIPIVSWLKGNSTESLNQAHKAGGCPFGRTLIAADWAVVETEQHDIGEILAHETNAIETYYELLSLAEGKSVLIE